MPESNIVASGDCKTAQNVDECPLKWYDWLYMPLIFLLSIPILTGWFLLLHRDITFSMARQIRAAIFQDKIWHFWQFGFTDWFTINIMMMTFDRRKERLSSTIKSGRKAIDAVCTVRTIFYRDQDFHLLFGLWNEFQVRDNAAFRLRDRRFFMERMGGLFNDQARQFLHVVMMLSSHDYLVLKYLCCKSIQFMHKSFRRIGPFELAFVDYFVGHQDFCRQCIQNFKPTILTMARQYVENMVNFCWEHKLHDAAHAWVDAGRQIIALQETEVTERTLPAIHDHLEKFFTSSDKACSSVYTLCMEMDTRVEEQAKLETYFETCEVALLPYIEQPANYIPAQQPISDYHDEWTKFYGRTIHWFKISKDGYTIYDTTVKNEYGEFSYKYSGITENASIVRKGLAFFFTDFEKNCKAYRDKDGDWIVTKENDFIKMTSKEMKNFINLLKNTPGMENFIPDVLTPKNTTLRSDGKQNNRSGKYRINPLPAYSSDDCD